MPSNLTEADVAYLNRQYGYTELVKHNSSCFCCDIPRDDEILNL